MEGDDSRSRPSDTEERESKPPAESLARAVTQKLGKVVDEKSLAMLGSMSGPLIVEDTYCTVLRWRPIRLLRRTKEGNKTQRGHDYQNLVIYFHTNTRQYDDEILFHTPCYYAQSEEIQAQHYG